MLLLRTDSIGNIWKFMAYSEKIKKQILQLVNGGLSPEQLVDKLRRDPSWRLIDVPDPKTIRNWVQEEQQKKEEEPPENIELKRQHDIRVFTASDTIMNEEKLRIFLWPLDGGPPIYYQDQADNVAEYLQFFSLEGNQYVDSELKQLNHNLCDALRELGSFLFHEFRTPNRIDRGDEKYSRLIPGELAGKYYEGKEDEEYEKRYWDYFEQLQVLNKNCEGCLEKYWSYIRDTLFI